MTSTDKVMVVMTSQTYLIITTSHISFIIAVFFPEHGSYSRGVGENLTVHQRIL